MFHEFGEGERALREAPVIVVDASEIVLEPLHGGEALHRMSVERLAATHLIDAEVQQTRCRLVTREAVEAEAADLIVERWTGFGVRRFAVNWLAKWIWALRHNVSAEH